MSWYIINHACGHRSELQMGGKMKYRKAKVEWLARQNCPHCWYAVERKAKADLYSRYSDYLI